MITRQEKSANVKDAKKAGVSEFEKNEVKKALDEIVSKAMAKKKAEGEAKKAESAPRKPASAAPVRAPKKPVTESRKIVDVPKTPMKGKRIDFVKKVSPKKTISKESVSRPMEKTINKLVKESMDRLVKEPAKKPEPIKTKKVAMKTKTVAKMPLMKSAKKVVAKKEVAKKKTSNTPSLVSIIMPVHNGARYIDSAIHSVLGQTFQDFELIIVDDCSEDGTLRVVREFSSDKIKSVALTQKNGMANARNVGVDKATGRYICFLNAHDMWQPEKLQMQLEFVQERNAAFSFTGYVYSDENGIPSGKAVRVPAEISGLQVARVSSILVSTVMLDMSKLTKNDIKMPAVRNPKTATWQKILKKVGRAYGLNEVLAIRGYDGNASLLKKMWRRV